MLWGSSDKFPWVMTRSRVLHKHPSSRQQASQDSKTLRHGSHPPPRDLPSSGSARCRAALLYCINCAVTLGLEAFGSVDGMLHIPGRFRVGRKDTACRIRTSYNAKTAPQQKRSISRERAFTLVVLGFRVPAAGQSSDTPSR